MINEHDLHIELTPDMAIYYTDTCPQCQRDRGQYDHEILWANGHGREIRHSCRRCGYWVDVRVMYKPRRTFYLMRRGQEGVRR